MVGGAKKNTGKTDHRYNFGANPCVCFSGAAALRAEERERESVRKKKVTFQRKKYSKTVKG